MRTKICTICKIGKGVESFDVQRNQCRECRAIQRFNRDSANRHTPEFKKKKQLSTIKWRHGMMADEYLEMVEKQENLCAICGNPPGAKALAIDHDHTTNKTRELLCVSCNFALGWFKDDIEVMLKAIAYIEKHNALDDAKPVRETVVEWKSGSRPAKIMRQPRQLKKNIGIR